jgi:hypothetical protein
MASLGARKVERWRGMGLLEWPQLSWRRLWKVFGSWI